MTQNEKDLLIKDLCARLPYGVKIQSTDENIITLTGINLPNHYSTINGVYSFDCYPMKPYLFPLSDMVKEVVIVEGNRHIATNIDWLNANHLDYRGLIEKGLAIDATGLNIY